MSHDLRLRKDWQSLEEQVGSATRRLEQSLREHPLRLALDPDFPLVNCDAVLIEWMLVNLPENAAKYNTVIGVSATAETDRLDRRGLGRRARVAGGPRAGFI